MAKYEKARKEIEKRSLPEVRFNLLVIACGTIKEGLMLRAMEMMDRLRLSVKAAFIARVTDLCARYVEIYVRLGQVRDQGSHPTETRLVARPGTRQRQDDCWTEARPSV